MKPVLPFDDEGLPSVLRCHPDLMRINCRRDTRRLLEDGRCLPWLAGSSGLGRVFAGYQG